MTRLFADSQPITVTLDEQGRPTAFTWQGRRHRLARVQMHWEVDTDWWTEEGRRQRAYWAVTTVGGMFCVIYRDMGNGAWQLERGV